MITTTSKKIKRVAIFCDFFNSLGGTEFYNSKLGLLLNASGVDVRFYVGEKPRLSYWINIISDQEIKVITPDKYHKVLTSREIEKDYVNLINEDFKKWKPNIIHTHPAGKLAISWMEKQYHRDIPIVATEWTTPGANTAHWYQPELPQFINLIDAFIATCEASHQGIIQYHKYKGKVEVIPHLVDLPSNNNFTLNGDNLNIGCIARLSVEKGIDFLLAAFAKLNLDIPKTRLYIYGHGDDKTRLQKLAHCLNIADQVVFEGVYEPFVGIDQVARKHNIFVQPSLYESIPTTIIELMARKRCIIATKVGGIPELFANQNGGILVEKANTEDIYVNLKTIIQNENEMKNISNNAYDIFISKYNIDDSFKKIVELYCKTIDQKKVSIA